MFKDYYKILGISRSASEEEIRRAYYKMSQKWHPDKHPNMDFTDKMQEINEAYSVLKSGYKKAQYDREYDSFYEAHEHINTETNSFEESQKEYKKKEKKEANTGQSDGREKDNSTNDDSDSKPENTSNDGNKRRKLIYILIFDLIFVFLVFVVPIILSINECTDKADSQGEFIFEKRQIELADSLALDSTAICNIHLNTTREQFEEEKKIFLAENDSLGKLKIKSVVGLFYRDRLAAIEILSEKQTIYRDALKMTDIQNTEYGWEYLYRKKYSEQSHPHNDFMYERGRVGMSVTDICASEQIYTSFNQLIEEDIILCESNPKNEDSWSVIIVGFIPAFQQYANDKIEEKRKSEELQRKIEEQKERERQEREQRELEKI